jgi:hypothetical protein
MKKDICIFTVSKDRPLQFQAMLESVLTNLDSHATIVGLVKTSNERYKEAYNQVYKEIKGQFFNANLLCWPENQFYEDFLTNLRFINTNWTYLLGLTDDCVGYRKAPDNLWSYLDLFDNEELLTLSLRLGQNTIVQDIEDERKKIVIPTPFEKGYTIWNWYRENPDINTGYSLSLDGHIYRTKDLLDLSESFSFKNLREWEGEGVAKFRDWVKRGWKRNLMACLENSYYVNIPMNFTQPPFHETVGPFGESLQEQLKRFEEGFRIDLEKTFFKDVVVKGSHQYVRFLYRKV